MLDTFGQKYLTFGVSQMLHLRNLMCLFIQIKNFDMFCLSNLSNNFDMSEETHQKFYLDDFSFDVSEETHQNFYLT